MEPTRRLQPALPHWMKPAAPERPPSPPTPEDPPSPDDPPDLYPFNSLEVVQPGQGGALAPQVYIGSGEHRGRERDDPPIVIYEFRLLGTGGSDGFATDSTLTLPGTAEMVLHGAPRWEAWVEAFATGDEGFLPRLLLEQRRSLLDLARFFRALCNPGRGGVDIGEWPFFWAVFTEGFPPLEHLRRGEVHLRRVAQWLRARYPHVYPDA